MVNRFRRFSIRCLYCLIDIFAVCAAIYVTCWICQHKLPFAPNFGVLFLGHRNPFQVVFALWLLAILFFNSLHGLYHTHRGRLETHEIFDVLKSVTLASLVTVIAIYIFKIEGFPRSVIIFGAVINFVFLSLWRIFKRPFVEYLVARGYNNFNVLIVGAGKVGQALAEEIRKRPRMGLRIAGYLDDFKTSADPTAGYPVLGKLSDFVEIMRKEFISEIFITIHPNSEVFLNLLEQARDLRASVRVIPQGFDLLSGEFVKYNIGFIPVLEYCRVETLSFKSVGKRLFDVFFSMLFLILFSPMFVFLALLVKMDSPGPIFYFSKRYGRQGKKFAMIKFRSMQINADEHLAALREQNEVDGPIFKIKSDPRVTKAGKFLRRYSLDELPQFFNVLVGDMSLVGPRPFPIDQIEKEDLRQLKRLEVRPGITGLWQIRGRSDISFFRLVRWDIWYINNWSFWLDMQILWQTIPVVLRGKGAY